MNASGARVTVRGTTPSPDVDVLSPDERRRAAGLRSPAARARYVTGRTCLRAMLAEDLGCTPRTVPLQAGPLGRPTLAEPSALSFSVSHTDDLVVVAVSATHTIGVDVERADRSPLPPLSAWLTDDERRTLEGLSPDLRQRQTVRRWTVKEAVAKALGTGLTEPLGSIEVVSLGARRVDAPSATWRVVELDVPAHVVATLVLQIMAKPWRATAAAPGDVCLAR